MYTNVFIVDIFNGYVLNICYVNCKPVDMYFSGYMLMYTVNLVDLLLERDKFCS